MKTTKRIVSAILCVLMIGSVLPLTAFAAYENTHVNTGNQIEDLIAVATTQIGYTEGNSTSQQGGTSGGSGNYTKYGAWYGINPGAWCAMFVSWCANQAGIPSTVITKHASCDLGMQWFQNKGVWQWSPACGGSYVPKRGDIIYFRTNTAQVTDSTHVGIVTSSTSSKVYTVEGNASNKCQTKSYSLSSAYILGYGTPNYTSGTTTGSLGTYQVTASSLNMRNLPTTSGSTILQALPNGAQIDIIQISNGWGYGTYNGTSGWISLSYATLVDPYYYITFDPNGGTLTSDHSIYAIKNNKQYNSIITTMPTAQRSGYDFGGWYNSEYDYTLKLTDTFVAGKDVTFKAQWSAKLGQYTITASSLNIRDGAGSADTAILGQIPNGTVVNITSISGDWGFTTYNGISGWVSLAYCAYYGELPEEEPDTPSAQTYTLTFDPNGGTMPAGVSTTYEFEAGEYLADVIGTFPIPTHSSKEFAGWYWDKAGEDSSGYLWNGDWGTQQYVFWNYPTSNDIADATLVAKWVTHTHTYESTVTKAATCQAAGVKTYTCTGCGDSYTETIAQLTHEYTSAITKAPTCTTVGITTYTCSLCGASYEDDIPTTDHSYAYSAGKVTCTVCSVGYDGWFNGTYYCTNGTCARGIFKIGSDFYYADSSYEVVKGKTVLVTSTEKNGLLSGGDSYYEFASDGKLVVTGFVTGGGNTYYYENTNLVTGLKKIDSDYYYFNADGTMVKDAYVEIGSGLGIEPGSYYFRADGKMLNEDTSAVKEVKLENGKYYLYIDGVKQANGLFLVDGDYYYALRDGSLATNRTLYTYYNNNILDAAYYTFGSDAKMVKDGWVELDDGRKYYLENGFHLEGIQLIDGLYYFFERNSGEMVRGKWKWGGNAELGVVEYYYYFGDDGYATTAAAATASVADGVETAGVTFSARAESNTVVSVDTAVNYTVAALATATGDDEDED